WLFIPLFMIVIGIAVPILFFLKLRDQKSATTKIAHNSTLPMGTNFDYPVSKADPIQILGLFKDRKYDELDSLLQQYQKDLEHDFRTEYTVFDAFDSFSNVNPKLEPFFDEWISKAPGSFAPYVARGVYCMEKGWKARGDKWASDTSDKQFQAMDVL